MENKEKIEKILNYHKANNPDIDIIKVTTTRYYEIPKESVRSARKREDLLKEWFDTYSATSNHAYRDSSLLLQHFNDDIEVA